MAVLSLMNLNDQYIKYVLWYFKFLEPDQRQQKCAQYWPDEETEGDQNDGFSDFFSTFDQLKTPLFFKIRGNCRLLL